MKLTIKIVDERYMGVPKARVYIDYAGLTLMNIETNDDGIAFLDVPESELFCTLWRVRKLYYRPVEIELDYVNDEPPTKVIMLPYDTYTPITETNYI